MGWHLGGWDEGVQRAWCKRPGTAEPTEPADLGREASRTAQKRRVDVTQHGRPTRPHHSDGVGPTPA